MGRTLFLSLLLATLATSAAATEVYRWTDAQGNVHFGERPPAAIQAEEVAIEPAPPADPATAERLKRQRYHLEDLEDERRQQASQRQRREAQQRQAQQRAAGCRQAQRRLALYRRAGPISIKERNGERRYLNDEQRSIEIGRIEASVRELCN